MSTPRTTNFTLKRIVENLGRIPEKGLGEEAKSLTPEQKRKLMEMASMFENFGECLRNEEALMNSAKGITELCELAETYALNECGDWFQQDIVKRDMKELKKRVMEFQKIAQEGYARMQQLGVAYQDIGHILGRYYDLKKAKSQSPENIQSEDLKRVCAWCKKDMGITPSKTTGITHGICDDCMKKMQGDISSNQSKGNAPGSTKLSELAKRR